MAKKTSAPTPCCKARVVLGDGIRLRECPKCRKVWSTYTAAGVVRFEELPVPT